MKIILLLEPPYSMISLELEDAASSNGYSYFSLSDAFMNEAGSNSALGKKINSKSEDESDIQSEYVYKELLRHYLKKAPKNTPNGFILDPDCVNSFRELQLLLQILKELEHELYAVVDIMVDQDNCYEYVPAFIDEDEAEDEIEAYFDEIYPQALALFHQLGIRVESFDEEDDPPETYRDFQALLKED
jgi:hypothetical protein